MGTRVRTQTRAGTVTAARTSTTADTGTQSSGRTHTHVQGNSTKWGLVAGSPAPDPGDPGGSGTSTVQNDDGNRRNRKESPQAQSRTKDRIMTIWDLADGSPAPDPRDPVGNSTVTVEDGGVGMKRKICKYIPCLVRMKNTREKKDERGFLKRLIGRMRNLGTHHRGAKKDRKVNEGGAAQNKADNKSLLKRYRRDQDAWQSQGVDGAADTRSNTVAQPSEASCSHQVGTRHSDTGRTQPIQKETPGVKPSQNNQKTPSDSYKAVGSTANGTPIFASQSGSAENPDVPRPDMGGTPSTAKLPSKSSHPAPISRGEMPVNLRLAVAASHGSDETTPGPAGGYPSYPAISEPLQDTTGVSQRAIAGKQVSKQSVLAGLDEKAVKLDSPSGAQRPETQRQTSSRDVPSGLDESTRKLGDRPPPGIQQTARKDVMKEAVVLEVQADLRFYPWVLPKPELNVPIVSYRLNAAPGLSCESVVGGAYQPLSVKRREIRLLEVSLTNRYSPVSCNLVTVSLDDNPEYVALSYVWGDPSDVETLWLNTQPFRATKSLVSAIRRCREAARVICLEQGKTSSSQAIRVWADALCIYSHRTTMKHLGTMRFVPQFFEGCDFTPCQFFDLVSLLRNTLM